MHGDFARWTHRAENHYRSVLLQQGRVLLDADFNEQTQIAARHDEVRTRDVVGRTGTPAPAQGVGGFAVVGPGGTVPAGAVAWEDLRLTPGRYYVDGVLAESEENTGDVGWPLTDQPHLRSITADGVTEPGLVEPEVSGLARYALYLDVFTHHVTADEDPALLEPALGGPDTSTRARTVWQVRARGLGAEECSDLASLVPPAPRLMAASLRPAEEDEDPCEISATGGYRLLENQLYRVQVHETAPATFLWSRENGSVTAALLGIEPAPAPATGSVLSVDRAGRDEELSIVGGHVVEVTSTDLALRGRPGFLATVTSPGAGGVELTVEWTGPEPSFAELGDHPVVRRWESLPLPVGPGTQELEGGILVAFPPGGEVRTGDHWLIPARTVRLTYGTSTRAGTIDWPQTGGAGVPLPPLGTTHHLAALAIVESDGEGWRVTSDCRRLFPALTDLVAIDLLGGDGQEAMPGDALDQPVRVAVRRGGLPVVGEQVRFTVVDGGISPEADGDGTPDDATFGQTLLDVPTDDDGVAAVRWRLGSAAASATTQTLHVRRVDDHEDDVGAHVVVTARHSVAAEVRWTPPAGCERFDDTRTVQEALTGLVTDDELRLLGGDGQQATQHGRVLPHPVRVVVDSPCGPVAGARVVVTAADGALVSPVGRDDGRPDTLEDRGEQRVEVETGGDGVVAVWWQPQFGDDGSDLLTLGTGRGQAREAPVQVGAHLAAAGGRTPGVHITALRFHTGRPFENDTDVHPDDLAAGFTVDLDAPVRQDTVQAKPVVRVELDLPWPFANEGGFWAPGVIGYRTVVLAAEWNADGPLIVWGPRAETRGWLQDTMWGVLAELGWEEPIVGRLEIDGWGIVGEEDPDRHLNCHARAVSVDGRTRLRLPTDDEVTGGTFVQWFRLTREGGEEIETVQVPQVVGRVLAEAREMVARVGLEVGRTTTVLSDAEPGTVIAVSPPEGTEVPVGSAVSLTVARRRIILEPIDPRDPIRPIDPLRPIRPPEGPDDTRVTVPDVTRMTRARAERLLGEAGVVAEVAEEPSGDVRRNSVVGTEPPGGSEVDPGSTVTMRVSTGRG